MDSSGYNKKIAALFRKYARGGFVSSRRCSRLCTDLCSLVQEAEADLGGSGEDAALFEVTGNAFLKWAETDIDDSNGESMDFTGTVLDIWNRIYARGILPHAKMLDWLIAHQDGGLDLYMEDCLRDFMMEHFKEPELLDRKYDFLTRRIRELTAEGQENRLSRIQSEILEKCRTQVKGERGSH